MPTSEFHRDFRREFGRLEVKVDLILENQAKTDLALVAAAQNHKELEKAHLALKGRVNWFSGVATACLAVIAFFKTQIHQIIFG